MTMSINRLFSIWFTRVQPFKLALDKLWFAREKKYWQIPNDYSLMNAPFLCWHIFVFQTSVALYFVYDLNHLFIYVNGDTI